MGIRVAKATQTRTKGPERKGPTQKGRKQAAAKGGAMATRRSGPRADNRRKQLLEVAADLFGNRGYARTSIRDIAAAVGMLPGSMYYHFKSKEDLLLAVHEQGVRLIMDAVDDALDHAPDDPWTRLEVAAQAHLKGLLTGGKFSMVVAPEFSRGVEEPLRSELIAQRDRYEQVFRDLVAALDLPAGVNRSLFRLGLLGSLNSVPNWYRPGGETSDAIASVMMDMLRRPLDVSRA